MKKSLPLLCLAALAFSLSAHAGSVHQQAPGSAAYGPNGSSALDAQILETRKLGAKTVARVHAGMNQWGFVTYWLGIPTPAGKSTLRFRVYHTGETPAQYAVYLSKKSGQEFLAKLEITEQTRPNSFVNVDIPVDEDSEWSGVVIKKTDATAGAGPWIESISVLLPD